MNKNEFKCGQCGEVFEKGWTDEEAKKEAKENFGNKVFEEIEMALVCDDCYKKLI